VVEGGGVGKAHFGLPTSHADNQSLPHTAPPLSCPPLGSGVGAGGPPSSCATMPRACAFPGRPRPAPQNDITLAAADRQTERFGPLVEALPYSGGSTYTHRCGGGC
jgi:hypothetical protein